MDLKSLQGHLPFKDLLLEAAPEEEDRALFRAFWKQAHFFKSFQKGRTLPRGPLLSLVLKREDQNLLQGLTSLEVFVTRLLWAPFPGGSDDHQRRAAFHHHLPYYRPLYEDFFRTQGKQAAPFPWHSPHQGILKGKSAHPTWRDYDFFTSSRALRRAAKTFKRVQGVRGWEALTPSLSAFTSSPRAGPPALP